MLLLNYVCLMFLIGLDIMGMAIMTFHVFNILMCLMLTMTLIKFFIAIDACFCFRNIALHLQGSSNSTNTKFTIYCFLSTSITLIYSSVWYVFSNNGIDDTWYDPYVAMRVIRIIRLIPIAGAFYYLRSASMDKKVLWSRFSLHIRLLAMLGGFSAIITIAEIFSLNGVINLNININDDDGNNDVSVNANNMYFLINGFGTILERAVIGILFTFKKDTFRFQCTHTIAHRDRVNTPIGLAVL